MQAAGRIHRLGQTREIFIKRYCFKSSVEEYIIKLHEKIKTGDIKIQDGHVPYEANDIMLKAAGDDAKQHAFTGPVHDMKMDGHDNPHHAPVEVQKQNQAYKDSYRKQNWWTRSYKSQECVTCGLYFVVALAFWVSMLYSAYAATSVELDPSSTYTSLI